MRQFAYLICVAMLIARMYNRCKYHLGNRPSTFDQNRFLFFSLWLAWVPVTYIIVVLLKLFLPETAVGVITIIYIGLYGAFWLKAMFSYTLFLCPRCGKGFLWKGGSIGGIWGPRLGATRCMNCGVQVDGLGDILYCSCQEEK